MVDFVIEEKDALSQQRKRNFKLEIAHVYDKNDKDNRAYTISPFTPERTWLPALRTAYDKSEDAAPEHQPECLQEL